MQLGGYTVRSLSGTKTGAISAMREQRNLNRLYRMGFDFDEIEQKLYGERVSMEVTKTHETR
jgi:hypothetical protein